jgi:hypothetical protein
LARADFRVREQRIIWKIRVCRPLDLDDRSASHVLGLMYSEPVSETGAWEFLISDFDQFKE